MKRRGAVREWLLIVAMTLCSHVLFIAGAAIAVGLAWYFDLWPFLLIGIAGVIAVGAESIMDRRAPGYTLRPQDEPELTSLIQRVAGLQGFDHRLIVRVVPEPGASLGYERVEGRLAYVLELGWPMLTLMSEPELSALMSHELAHIEQLSAVRGRLGVSSRNRLAEAWEIPVVTGALLSMSRDETVDTEHTADQVSAATFGSEHVASALIRTAEIDGAFETLAEDWCDVMTDVGEYPADIYECVRLALDDPEVQAWLAMNHEREPQFPDPGDTHPTIRQRISDLGLADIAVRVAGDPAHVRQAAQIEQWCLEETFELGETGLRPGSIRTSPLGRFDYDPHQALADIREATNQRETPRALHLAAERITDGSWRRLAAELAPDLEEAPAEFRGEAEEAVIINCLGTALISPLVAAGWTRANPWLNQILESPEGGRVNVFQEVELAVAESNGERVHRLVAAAQLGIEVRR
ncbi:MAG: M48 family metallopeptidase [Actinomycetota bacterium]|nr:M48 family metallopeptidase [Actinomycetota bacterium]